MPVPDRSDVEWRVGPVFMEVPVLKGVIRLERYAYGARLESRCSDRITSQGRDRTHLDDAPREARRAALDPQDSGKHSPVAHRHRIQEKGRGAALVNQCTA
ncbi:hypothetical protein NDU88_000760 [Pleurodeles waltl]|uniref:Uncharacterized protein n=1 Tax=Pleurodeles waltl TaxID=8319 RepID=A0AAV7L924_PLEWA|nr:hypothetical protein NDU88_000760 [Pleurodeles waltl]